jgi:hypothetical protein
MLGALPPIIPIALAVPTVATTTNNVATLVRRVHNRMELRYEPFLGEADAKVVGR